MALKRQSIAGMYTEIAQTNRVFEGSGHLLIQQVIAKAWAAALGAPLGLAAACDDQLVIRCSNGPEPKVRSIPFDEQRIETMREALRKLSKPCNMVRKTMTFLEVQEVWSNKRPKKTKSVRFK